MRDLRTGGGGDTNGDGPAVGAARLLGVTAELTVRPGCLRVTVSAAAAPLLLDTLPPSRAGAHRVPAACLRAG